MPICPQCEKSFRANWVGHRFCSRACANLAQRSTNEDATCVCGKKFYATPISGGKRRKYCSRSCYTKAYRGPNHPYFGKRTRQDVIPCANCGKDFKILNGAYTRKYCSRKCWQERMANGGHPLGDNRVGAVRIKTFKSGYQVRIIKCADGKWRKEHRVIVERMIGRPLLPSEIVHHKNGNATDNRDENLAVMGRKAHIALHHEAEAIGLSVMCAEQWIPTIEGMAC